MEVAFALVAQGLIKTLIFSVLSPLLGFILGAMMMILVSSPTEWHYAR